MTVSQAEARLDVWERREGPVMAVAPYVLLVVVTGLTVLISDAPASSIAVDVGLAVAIGAWMLWMFTLHLTWRERPRLMGLYFVVLVTLMAALVIRAPWFGFFTWTGYVYAYYLPAGARRLAGVLAVAVVTATSQNGGLPDPHPTAVVTYVMIIVINAVVAGGISWFAWVGAEQNERRKQAVAELEEANGKLRDIMQENAGLQVQLVAQAREAGVLDERQRMAREIHDTLAQGLTGIITQIQAAEQAVPSDPVVRVHLEAAASLARESLSEARRSVQALRPEPLVAARLPEALADVVGRWEQLNGVCAEVTTTGHARPMHPEIEVILLRTAQEALANVAKHADATRVALTLSYMEDLVTLDVRDDGVGFEPAVAGTTGPAAGPTGGGFGLTAMAERVHGIAGVLEIESEPGGGTAISARVPAIVSGSVS
jgi:signal transduction histidine kinase